MKKIAFLLLLPFLLIGEEPIWLSWSRDPTTTMTIQWISDKTGDSVRYEGPDGVKTAAGKHTLLPYDTRRMVHRAELTGLKPGTVYSFSLPEREGSFRFRTLPEKLPVRFVIGGDMYPEGEETLDWMRKTNTQAAKANPAFAVIGGDIAYSSSSFWFIKEDASRWDTWLDTWFETMVTPDGFLIPIIPAIGNHEVNGRYGQTPAQAKYFYTLFPLDDRAYRALTFGDYLTLILLDSNHTAPINGAQTQWLEKTLASASTPNVFAVYHVPAYPSARSFGNKHSQKIRRFWTPLFDKYGLDIAFEHHDHTYKRTPRIKKNRPDPTGTLYVGDGAWSPDIARPLKKKEWYLEKFLSERHFIIVDLTPGARRLTVVSPSGQVLDSF